MKKRETFGPKYRIRALKNQLHAIQKQREYFRVKVIMQWQNIRKYVKHIRTVVCGTAIRIVTNRASFELFKGKHTNAWNFVPL